MPGQGGLGSFFYCGDCLICRIFCREVFWERGEGRLGMRRRLDFIGRVDFKVVTGAMKRIIGKGNNWNGSHGLHGFFGGNWCGFN